MVGKMERGKRKITDKVNVLIEAMDSEYTGHDQEVKTVDAYQEGREVRKNKSGSFKDNPYMTQPERGAWGKGFFGDKL